MAYSRPERTLIDIDNLFYRLFVFYRAGDREEYVPGNVVVYFDGTVYFARGVIYRFKCDMVLLAFPFDQQECSLRTGSWSYDGTLLDYVIPDTNAFDVVSEYHENREWELVDAYAYRTVLTYNVTSLSDPTADPIERPWPEVYFVLKLKRKHTFYLITLLIPYFMISSLSGLVFVLQPDSGEKMGLAITTLLSLLIFNDYVVQIIPPTSDFFPIIGMYVAQNIE